MLATLSAIVPIFLIVALGYIMTRAGMFSKDSMRVLARYVVKIALPALIFVNVSGSTVAEIFNPTYLLTYALAAMTMVGFAQVWNHARKTPPTKAAALSLTVSGTNNGFYGFPMLLLLLPSVAGLAVGMDMMVDNVLILPVALVLFEAASPEQSNTWGRRLIGIAKRVLTHPMVIAIAAALTLTIAGLNFPSPLQSTITLVANSSPAVALFSLGGMLVGMKLSGQKADMIASATAKLILMPLVGVGLVFLLPAIGLPELSPELRAAAILTCALPSMSAAAQISEQYGEGEYAAGIIMVSTILSFPTLAAWLFTLNLIGWV